MWWQRSRAEALMRMNNGRFEPCTLDDPEGQYQTLVYNKLLNNRRTALTRYLQGEIMVAVRLVLRQRFTRVVCAEVQQVEDRCFCRLIYRFTVNKMILKYQSGPKTQTNERHDETGERGRNWLIPANLKPDDFLRAKYEHMMNSLDWWNFLQILEGLEAGHPGLRAVLKNEGRAIQVTNITPRRWPYFGLIQWGLPGYRLATDNTKLVSPFFC